MSYLQDLLKKLLYRNRDLCCLCLGKIVEDRTDLDDDEVVLYEKNSQKILQISEIFSYVFGDEVFSKISVFEDICIQCVTTTVNTYKFMKDCKDNLQHLTNAVDYIKNGIDQASEDTDDCNSLFVAFTSDLSISGHCYDNISSHSDLSEVFKKFDYFNNGKLEKDPQSLVKIKKKHEIIKDECKKERKRDKYGVRLNEILYEKSDSGNKGCKYCFKQFGSISALKNHYMRIHAPKKFQCPECPKKFGNLYLVNAHRIANHAEMYMCTDCGKIFSNVNTLKEHEKTHTQTVCPDCGRTYKNRTTFKKHKDNNVCGTGVRHSPADAKFTCDYCQKKYTQKMSLRVHIQYEHLNYKCHVCEWCNKKFWCKARLNAHIVTHTKEKNHICTICNGAFVTKESLLYHTRIHTGERPYACNLCDNKFLSASRRLAHIRSQHMSPIICTICNTKFKSVYYYMKHKKLHAENKVKDKMVIVKIQEDQNQEDTNENMDSRDNLNSVDNKTYIKFEYQNENDSEQSEKSVKYILVKDTKQEQVYLEVSENVEV